jgi:hypothetical protein
MKESPFSGTEAFKDIIKEHFNLILGKDSKSYYLWKDIQLRLSDKFSKALNSDEMMLVPADFVTKCLNLVVCKTYFLCD